MFLGVTAYPRTWLQHCALSRVTQRREGMDYERFKNVHVMQQDPKALKTNGHVDPIGTNPPSKEFLGYSIEDEHQR